ncbi:MAG: hypothetical protein GC145_15105 [Caulobacter sp.]|nr:hypothetical protein [Caulobacter sp.]
MGRSISKEIAGEVEDVFDDVVHNLKKMARHLGEDASDTLSGTAAALAHSAVHLMEEAKAQSKTFAAKAGQEIRAHPAETAAIAAAAVAMIGLAISQRKSRAD